MCPSISTEIAETKIRNFVNKSSVFRSQRQMPGDAVIRPAAVNKGTLRLRIRAGNEPAKIVGWAEYQGAASSKHIGKELMKPERKVTTMSPVTE